MSRGKPLKAPPPLSRVVSNSRLPVRHRQRPWKADNREHHHDHRQHQRRRRRSIFSITSDLS